MRNLERRKQPKKIQDTFDSILFTTSTVIDTRKTNTLRDEESGSRIVANESQMGQSVQRTSEVTVEIEDRRQENPNFV